MDDSQEKWEEAEWGKHRPDFVVARVAANWATRLAEYWAERAAKEKGEQMSQQRSDNEKKLEYIRKIRIGTEFHGFMHLPREIRDMIYECRLLKGTIFMPNHRDVYDAKYNLRCMYDFHGRIYQRYEGIPHDWGHQHMISDPSTRNGLICGVSRTVQREAARIFYGRNRFVFPYGNIGFDMFYGRVDLPIYRNVGRQLRDVSYTFDMREEGWSDYYHRYSAPFRPDEEEGVAEGIIPEIFLQEMHLTRKDSLASLWEERVQDLKSWALNRLQIDFEECYCGMGCCRMVDHIVDIMVNFDRVGPWTFMPPKIIEILGWNDNIEKKMIREALETLSSDERLVEVRFVGKSKAEVRAEMRRGVAQF